MKKTLIALLLLSTSSSFAETATLIDVIEPAQKVEFYCAPHMDSALKNKRKLIWNKIGVYTLRGAVVVAPVVILTATGAGIGGLIPVAAGEMAGVTGAFNRFIGGLIGFFGGAGIAASMEPSNFIPTREQKILDLKILMDAATFSEEELMTIDYEERVAEIIKREEKIRSDRGLPALTETDIQKIRRETAYGHREKTYIDEMTAELNKAGDKTYTYNETRDLVIAKGADETFCPANRRGTDHRFLSMRKIVKVLRRAK